ncbi:enoyl-CoA hydratase-related protein [Curtobacterium sp. S6]|uniref:enoyl-CoA hydratase-related protein n=1 Tax=Curtobacterium sp. S6 TaxID=1479623 RepID=UPI0004AB85C1|nr:enoyl-CoA hydratase-related protein [Curtobacterium sp. S6]
MSQDISVALQEGVLTVTLTRPQKKNALTNPMYSELADALERAETDSAVRVVVLRSEGDLFTAGNDIGDFAAEPTDATAASIEEKQVRRFIRALVDSTTPIIAAVQGKAVGVGTTMLLHCDYVILSENAQLITPFVNLALVPEAASSMLLNQRIGHARAFAMFALGEPLDAPAALAGGVANRVLPQADLHDEAQRIAAMLAVKPAGALTATKRLMRATEPMLAQIEAESALFDERLASAEAREAFAAFKEKRTPDFVQFA